MRNLSLILKNKPYLVKKSAKKHKRTLKKKNKAKKGGFLGVLASAVAPHLIKAGVDGIAGLIKRKKKGKGISSVVNKYAPKIKSYITTNARKYGPVVAKLAKRQAINFAIDNLKQLKGNGLVVHGRRGDGLAIHGRGMKRIKRGAGAKAPTRPFKVTYLKHGTITPNKILS